LLYLLENHTLRPNQYPLKTSSIFQTITRALLSVFNPKICIGCDDSVLHNTSSIICSDCIYKLSYTHHFSDQSTFDIHKKFYGRFNIDFGAALFYSSSESVGRAIIHGLKYKNRKDIGVWIANRIFDRLKDNNLFPNIDLITCVPIHEKKLESRGYNQSAIVAEQLAELLNIPAFPNLLIKIIETKSQTTMSRLQRIDNVINTIAIDESNFPLIKAKKILIIDDTLTTGVTIESCGKILLRNGAKSLSVICMAQAI
jgi:ComF family protein